MKTKALLFLWPLLFITSAAQLQTSDTPLPIAIPVIPRLDTLDAKTELLNKKLAEITQNGKDIELATRTRGGSPFQESRTKSGKPIDSTDTINRVTIWKKIGRFFRRIFG